MRQTSLEMFRQELAELMDKYDIAAISSDTNGDINFTNTEGDYYDTMYNIVWSSDLLIK